MRQKLITLYGFNELPPEVQKKAYEQDPAWHTFGESFTDDFKKTLEAFENLFGVRVTNWAVGSHHCSFDFVLTEEAAHPENISNPAQLAAWVKDNPAHHINIMEGQPLTGACWDDDILAPVRDCLTQSVLYTTYEDLITSCLYTFFNTWSEALVWSECLEYYEEEATENGWEYTATGRRWHE